jgi:hypothetical protein
VVWSAATDAGGGTGSDAGVAACAGGAAEIRYHVCADQVQANCVGAAFNSHIRVTTAFGATATDLTGLFSRTDYFVAVRAEDRAGNVETADHTTQARTATSWFKDVQPLLFIKCISCHSGEDRNVPDGRDVQGFDKLSDIVGVKSSTIDDAACAGGPHPPDGSVLDLIDDEGRPEFSLIYRKINAFTLKTPPFSDTVPNLYTGLQEPRDTGGGFTSDEDLAVREWIEQGALGN